VNLDETPMAKQMTARRGYICEFIGTLECDWHARITTRDARSHATLMAAVLFRDSELPVRNLWCYCVGLRQARRSG